MRMNPSTAPEGGSNLKALLFIDSSPWVWFFQLRYHP
jgi:hypothetical protein